MSALTTALANRRRSNQPSHNCRTALGRLLALGRKADRNGVAELTEEMAVELA